VFYTFLVKNDCWWMRRKLSNPKTFLEGREETRKKILSGIFPNYLIERFSEVLNYFGQAPIIVRSSSLQEDTFGNSFSGKYESFFLANQGTFNERLKDFINAVRKVYASAINKDALIYRKNRNLLDTDEQMAILVQRVSGINYGKYFFPHVAGVGYSFNPYVWDKKIDPHAGFLRLVVGLGTRAVNRIEDDFTRLVALNKPLLQVQSNLDEIQNFSQKKVDILDLHKNALVTTYFREIESIPEALPYLTLVATRNIELENRMKALNKSDGFYWVLTFNNLLTGTQFTNDIKKILKILENTYRNPIDIEFTLNFFEDRDYKVNLVQCRHFQVKNEIANIAAPTKINQSEIIIKNTGPIIGSSIAMKIDRIIYIVPSIYGKMKIGERYSVARLIGKINQLEENLEKKIMLLGPGRWGTSTPSLGIPVSFAEINNISILCEIAEKTGGLFPDVSLGTHFFNNLVELDILYFVLYPEREENILNMNYFQNANNNLIKLIPEANNFIDVVKIIDVNEKNDNWVINVNMNTFTQMGVCYLTKNKKKSQRNI
ncbi:MAG: PEP/pyruvate-binding domain-containing protein, partial [Promethearchaeota archaeon]